MSLYPLAILMLAGVAVYIGLENLLLVAYSRRRAHLWVGLMALCNGAYCLASYKLYTAVHPRVGGLWQLWQLFFGALMLAFIICLGLEFLGKLNRVAIYSVLLPAFVANALLPLPGLGLTGEPLIKTVSWAGLTYYEMALGPVPLVYYAVALLWMPYLVWQFWRKSRTEGGGLRLVSGVYLFWVLAVINDMAVAHGWLSSVYLVEYAFFAVIGVSAALLARSHHAQRRQAERQQRSLAEVVAAKERDLAANQAELLQAARMAEVGRLAAGVAHEVNNPLTYVRGNLDLLARELAGDEELCDWVRDARDGVDRIKKVVRQLYAFSEMDTGAGPGDVNAAAEIICAGIEDRFAGCARVLADLPSLPPVKLNNAMLHRVLGQVMVNAGQAMVNGDPTRDRIELRGRVPAGERVVELVITDTGEGIDPKVLPEMFEPFVTTQKAGKGVGLGLAITRAILAQVGGEIQGHNRPRGGARFRLTIPLAEPTEPADANPTPRDDPTRDKKRRLPLTPSQELPTLT